jgi:hypothetical protein
MAKRNGDKDKKRAKAQDLAKKKAEERKAQAKAFEDAMRKDEMPFKNRAIDKIENARKTKYETITRMEAAKLAAQAKKN